MKTSKQVRFLAKFALSVFLAAAIVSIPFHNAYAWPVKTIETQHRISPDARQRIESAALANDIKKIEREFRKIYNLPSTVEVRVIIDTNPPPTLHQYGEVIPAGTTQYNWDSPLSGPQLLLPVWCIITVVVIIVTIAGYIIYHVVKMCKRCLGSAEGGGTNTNYVAEASVGMTMTKISDITEIVDGLPNATANVNVVGKIPNFNVDTMTGDIAFTIQSTKDFMSWKTECIVTNSIKAGISSVSVYDSIGNPILTNISRGLLDGENLIYAPNDIAGCVIKDKTEDSYKFWRIRLLP